MTDSILTEADQKTFTLHRYFIWADRQRKLFDDAIKKSEDQVTLESFTEVFMYMSLWYGLLYVVIEAWSEIELSDQRIDDLLESSNVSLLRRYRNSCFHFQPDYFNQKQADFISSQENPVTWVREVHQEFSRYFLKFIRSKK